jgi:phosphopantetheinyl transferase
MNIYLGEPITLVKPLCTYLSPFEQKYYSQLLTDRRKLDFVMGRLVAKYCLIREVDIIPITSNFEWIEFRYGEYGEPLLHLLSELESLDSAVSDFNISISHCNNVAVSNGKHGMVGIDIERLREFSASHLQFYLTPIEQIELHQQFEDKNKGALLYWTIKEAALKSLKLGLSFNLKDIEIYDIDLRLQTAKVVITSKKQLDLHARFLDYNEYVISAVSESSGDPLHLCTLE